MKDDERARRREGGRRLTSSIIGAIVLARGSVVTIRPYLTRSLICALCTTGHTHTPKGSATAWGDEARVEERKGGRRGEERSSRKDRLALLCRVPDMAEPRSLGHRSTRERRSSRGRRERGLGRGWRERAGSKLGRQEKGRSSELRISRARAQTSVDGPSLTCLQVSSSQANLSMVKGDNS